MNSRILKLAAAAGLGIIFAWGCRNMETELLEPKLYFESLENVIDIGEDATMTFELESRLSSSVSSDVQVTYTIENDQSYVDEYNKRFGREYPLFTGAALESDASSVPAGEIYSDAVNLSLSGLDAVQEGENYVIPIRVRTGDVPVISGSDMTYVIVRRLPKITTVARFNNSFFKIPISPLNVFNEVTYEAIVNVSSFGNNNTVMGCEGVMIMRIGDAGGGTVPRDILQMAGKSEITWTDNPLEAGKWYHLAFTCNSAGEACLYVNGENVIKSTFTMSQDLTANGADYGFSVGMVPRFMWGTRPFYGYMSEVRLWDVVRTANQIKENMLVVNPSTPGLVAYYKLNGDLNDSSPNGYNPTDFTAPSFETIDVPIAIGGGLTEE